MLKVFDVIIIGLGAMGSAAAHHLAQRGAKVLGLEQFDIPHNLGSSHGQSRMIRMAYYEHPDYVPLLRRAYELWKELEDRSGQKLLHITGGVYIGPADGEVVGGTVRSAQQHGLPHELLDETELARRFPQFRLPKGHVGVIEPMAGFVRPDAAVIAQAELAMRAGAELHGREPVVGWSADSSGVTVKTTLAEYHAQKLIVTSGPWAGKVLGELGAELKVTRQLLGWVWPGKPELFEMGRFPVWGIEQSDGGMAYGFPIGADGAGMKLALHAPGKPADPDHVQRECDQADREEIIGITGGYFPEGVGPILSMRTCLYTYSPDSHFIIDHHPHHANVVFAAGFSGHGFKFAPVIGEILADLAMHGKTSLPAAFLELRRFK